MIYLNGHLTEKMEKEYVSLFEKAYTQIAETLGTDAFRFALTGNKRRPINMSLMEVLTLLFDRQSSGLFARYKGTRQSGKTRIG